MADRPQQQQGVGPAQPSYSSGSGPSGPRAGFWRRFGASFIDGIILGAVNGILTALLGRNAGNTLALLVGLGYYIYLEGSPSGQTIGKKLLSIRVIDFNAGGQIGYGRAAIRYLGRIVSTIPLFLGYLWMLWDKEKQTWHDKMATSVVVPTDAYPVTDWPG